MSWSWRLTAPTYPVNRIRVGRSWLRWASAVLGGVAFHAFVALSPSDAQLDVAPLWCNQHGGDDLTWVTVSSKGPRPYQLQLSGNPGLNPTGGVAWLSYFTGSTGQPVHFVSNIGSRLRLPPVTLIVPSSGNPSDYKGTIDLPPSILNETPDERGLVGHLVFEIQGIVTETVPLYWPTSNVAVTAVSSLPEWDPLEATHAGHATGSSRLLEFRMTFRGCPPLRAGIGMQWAQTGGGAPFSKAQVDRYDAAGIPGVARLWVDEADLTKPPLGGRARPDWIYVYASATDRTHTYFRLRRPFTVTRPLRPSRIDLGFKECWYQIDIDYTGGHPISRIAAFDRKGSPSPQEVRWLVKRTPFTGGALLQLEIPAYVAIQTESQTPSRVWVDLAQSAYPGETAAGLEVPVVNFPIPASDALPPGCNWDAPSKLPAHP